MIFFHDATAINYEPVTTIGIGNSNFCSSLSATNAHGTTMQINLFFVDEAAANLFEKAMAEAGIAKVIPTYGNICMSVHHIRSVYNAASENGTQIAIHCEDHGQTTLQFYPHEEGDE